MGLSATAMLISVQNSVGWAQRGVATATVQFSRTIGGAVFVAALGTLLTSGMASRLANLDAELQGADALLDAEIRGGLSPETLETLHRLEGLLDFLLPLYEKEGKAQISIALGCTGGRHRSVFIAEALRELLITKGFSPSLIHRDLERV